MAEVSYSFVTLYEPTTDKILTYPTQGSLVPTYPEQSFDELLNIS